MTTFLSSSTLANVASVAMAGLLLASCQTGAEELLSMGDATPAASIARPDGTLSGYQDPMVVAMAGKTVPASDAPDAPNDGPAPTLKRNPSPMASAYTEIAEPPPEVLAQQIAKMGNAAQSHSTPQASAADLGDLTMQETGVRAGTNSIFAAARSPAPLPEPEVVQPGQVGQNAASTSIVPSDLPVVGVRAVSKSLFSPTIQASAAVDPAAATMPVAEPTPPAAQTTDDGPPVLRKLSDPRPKRKMLALREPQQQVPQQVQMTEEQLTALGAVAAPSAADVASAAEPLADPATNAAPATTKKRWMPSLSKLLSGGTAAKAQPASP
ncbi:hypothetical protein ACSV9I_03935 [Rhizobium sp. G187]|uniref:hypothetical protein n=1 Tax=Rhizobium sp. G187 TaxID=3451352 RepID=UPI003EE7A9E9